MARDIHCWFPLADASRAEPLPHCARYRAPCAATGVTDELVYVSPKSGRAVSAEAGAPWRDRLLPLPPFLRDDAPIEARPSAEEIADGFRLTGFFLARDLFALHGEPLPDSRAAFLKAVAQGR